MAKSRLRDGTEPAMFVPEIVAMQHDVTLLRYVYAGAIAFWVLASARTSFWLHNNNRKLFESFNE